MLEYHYELHTLTTSPWTALAVVCQTLTPWTGLKVHVDQQLVFHFRKRQLAHKDKLVRLGILLANNFVLDASKTHYHSGVASLVTYFSTNLIYPHSIRGTDSLVHMDTASDVSSTRSFPELSKWIGEQSRSWRLTGLELAAWALYWNGVDLTVSY